MAGSTISSGVGTSTTTCTTYRLTIDISKICDNVLATEGGRLSEQAVRDWLCSAGFSHQPADDTWIARKESLYLLDRSEVVRAERVDENF